MSLEDAHLDKCNESLKNGFLAVLLGEKTLLQNVRFFRSVNVCLMSEAEKNIFVSKKLHSIFR